jgi:hypothetical protein
VKHHRTFGGTAFVWHVSLLTGFLGSGKTTLLNRLLAHSDMELFAVIINEFGEVGLDHLVVQELDDDVVLLQSGCICCTVQGQLVEGFPPCPLHELCALALSSYARSRPYLDHLAGLIRMTRTRLHFCIAKKSCTSGPIHCPIYRSAECFDRMFAHAGSPTLPAEFD